MSDFFTFIFLISFIALIVGLIRPKLFKFAGSKHPRTVLGILFGSLTFVSMVIAAATMPPDPTTKITAAAKSSTTTPTQNKPTSTHVVSATDRAQLAKGLTDSTNFYQGLISQGQQILGTTPYPDAEAGLAALDDPNSMASKWSAFNQSAMSTDYFHDHATPAYNAAVDAYGSSSYPASLDDWHNDMNQAESDFHEWVQKATSWTDSEITSDQLAVYANTFQQDLVKARSDIASFNK
jgi:hypothetical protein